jgi:hypothetical protein
MDTLPACLIKYLYSYLCIMDAIALRNTCKRFHRIEFNIRERIHTLINIDEFLINRGAIISGKFLNKLCYGIHENFNIYIIMPVSDVKITEFELYMPSLMYGTKSNLKSYVTYTMGKFEIGIAQFVNLNVPLESISYNFHDMCYDGRKLYMKNPYQKQHDVDPGFANYYNIKREWSQIPNFKTKYQCGDIPHRKLNINILNYAFCKKHDLLDITLCELSKYYYLHELINKSPSTCWPYKRYRSLKFLIGTLYMPYAEKYGNLKLRDVLDKSANYKLYDVQIPN